MAEGMIGYGSTLTADGNPIAHVVDISGPDVTIASVKVTNNDSPDRAQEKIPGLVDAGQVTFNCIYTKAGLQALSALALQCVVSAWQHVYADGGAWTTDEGFIVKLSQGDPLEDKATVDVTVEWSGLPTFG